MTGYGRVRQPGPVDLGAAGSVPLPASVRALWVADDASAVGDGNLVSSWVDRVNGFTLANTSTARPAYRTAGLNGQPSLQFDGSNDALILTASNPVSTATSGCVIAVATAPVGAGGQTYWSTGDDATGNYYMGGLSISGQLRMQAAVSASAETVYATPPAATAIYEWSSSGAAWTIRLNNALVSLTVGGGSNTGRWFGNVAGRDRFGIGALLFNAGTNNFMNGHISLLMVVDAPLSTADRLSQYGYLSATYGIAA